MKANLIYNPNAGGTTKIDLDSLLVAFKEIGWEVTHLLTTTEEDLDKVLKDIEGYLIVVGGDGTIRGVATRVIGNPKVKLVPIPLGTANNIATSLDLQGTPQELIASLIKTKTVDYDMGHLIAPWGEDYFLEAVGVGLFADSMAMYDPEDGKSVSRAIGTATAALPNYNPHDLVVTVDDKDISGQYVLLEVLNTQATGPKLKLAPTASPNDGLLDVVGIRANERTTVLGYLRNILAGTLDVLHNVEHMTAESVQLTWTGYPVHVDGMLRTEIENEDLPKAQLTNPHITIKVLPKALTFIIPDHD